MWKNFFGNSSTMAFYERFNKRIIKRKHSVLLLVKLNDEPGSDGGQP